ncbi:MAG: response regulator transcription factor [Chloroflexaceae bacterium]|nr:response regulator transcription factor [Chloroflexaceae bacterium]
MKPRILLVEDHDKTRNMLAHLLASTGYHVTQAPNGEIALELLKQEPFDIILTDIVMGNVDGIEVLYTARQLVPRPAVILLTGHGTLETCIAALREGAFDYLLKPCSDEQLLRCIAAALHQYHAEQRVRRAVETLAVAFTDPPEPLRNTDSANLVPEPEPSPPQTIGSLIIGATRQSVRFHGQPVPITPIEFSLLRFLAVTPGQPATYCDIVRHTHHLELNSVEAQRLLSSHVRNLRRKLDKRHLVHEHGVGYKLVNPNENWEDPPEP